MGNKITFDATNRKFVVTIPPDVNDIIEIDLQVDLYSDGKEDWVNDGTYPDLSKMIFPISAIGGDSFGTETLGISYLIKNGWTFKPYETDHTLRLVGNIGTEGGWELVDDTIGAYRVRVENKVSSIVSLANVTALEAASFNGQVAINVNSPYAGTTFPRGTRGMPVNNLIDAHAIASIRGLDTFIIMADMTLDEGDFSEGHRFLGVNPASVTITIADAAEVSSCEFANATIQGTLDSANILRDCSILDITHVNGFIVNCALFGTVTLGGSEQAMIMDSYSGIAGGGPSQYPYIDMGGTGNSLAMRGYAGGLGIKNSSGVVASSLDFDSGRAIFDADCTGGDFTVRGICDVTDNSNGAVINDHTINLRLDESLAAEELTQDQAEAEVITDPVNGLLIRRNIPKQIRWEADAWEDFARTQRYRGKGMEVVGNLYEVAWS